MENTINNKDNKNLKGQSFLDKLGVSAATVCFIHCLITPFIGPLIATLGITFLVGERVEFYFFSITMIIAFIALSLGFFRHHKKWQPYFLFFLATAVFTYKFYFAGHDHHHCEHGQGHINIVDIVSAFLIGGFLVASHLINLHFCKKCRICEKEKKSQ